jgi:hypothetical protein
MAHIAAQRPILYLVKKTPSGKTVFTYPTVREQWYYPTIDVDLNYGCSNFQANKVKIFQFKRKS